MGELLKELNEFLADLNVLYRKLQNYHWNVKGKNFFVLHSKLEEYYNGVNSEIDEIAEKILMLGGQPLGTMKDYLEISKIKEAENVKISGKEVLKNVLEDFGYVKKKAEFIKVKAEEASAVIISSYMDEVIEDYSKAYWMLSQSME
ncbi:starvation-inducible DNA-binding protein [Anaerosporobacter mobilis DSM 15930]|jgi:starvation-inducible DNA-binding protein|uniref:Starvation-inducible DNA-binding protein n=1 Tax=Anaerosporobacter mobilis DSM 15930 TaxID=1120996 RepID=A0A1M7KDY2_9FIRM|nr:DNA starvation/stationary phase protection protein [Anaerosporobacter mobilis]SHM63492.1 starvation-inducible DNA-binding protein [Anaerosporobacter mobilis DSM 15930]